MNPRVKITGYMHCQVALSSHELLTPHCYVSVYYQDIVNSQLPRFNSMNLPKRNLWTECTQLQGEHSSLNHLESWCSIGVQRRFLLQACKVWIIKRLAPSLKYCEMSIFLEIEWGSVLKGQLALVAGMLFGRLIWMQSGFLSCCKNSFTWWVCCSNTDVGRLTRND